MSQEVDLGALRAMVLVAEEGSISAASARLGVSQQAVSSRLISLENDLKTRLLARSTRGCRLTPSGELVVGRIRSLLAAADEFSSFVRGLQLEQGKTMAIAAGPTIAEHLLPEWSAKWRDSLGDDGAGIRFTAANSSAVVDAVREGTIDLGFIETCAVPADLGSVTVGYDRIEVLVPRDHPWARTAIVSIPELAETALVLREAGSGARQALEDALSDAGYSLRVKPAAVLSTTLAIRSAVIAGVAPGVLSSLAAREDIRSGRLARVRVKDLKITRPLTAIWAGRVPSRSAQDLLSIIAQGAKDA